LNYDFSTNLPKDPKGAAVGPTTDYYLNLGAEPFTNMVWRSVKRFGVGVTDKYVLAWYCDMPLSQVPAYE
jgi:hypothetical protein